jgi:hypothetical protein
MMVIVGFQARVRSVGLAWLKQGFRHCFAYQRADRGWVLCDPLACGLLLRSAPDLAPRALLTSLAALGATVVAVESQLDPSRLPWLRPLTCVEVCKRLLGRRAGRVMTPHQLFRDLLVPLKGVDSVHE